MFVMNVLKSVPQLRFPNFTNAWKTQQLGEIATNKSLKYKPTANAPSFKCIELEHLSSETGILLGHIDSRQTSSVKHVFTAGTILYGKLRPYLKKHYFCTFNGVCSTEIWVLTKQNIAGTFLYALIQSYQFNCLANVATGSKMPRADWRVLAKAMFFVPPTMLEQQKIGKFLRTIDQRIANLTQTVTLWQRYKEGVLQQIFTQQLPFTSNSPQGFRPWTIKKLRDIAVKVQHKNTKGKYKFVLTNAATQGIISQQQYFDKPIANPKNLQQYYITQTNDFVYNPRISKQALCGPIKRNKLRVGVMSPLYTVFRFNKGNLLFYEYFFESKLWHKYMYSIANVGARHDRMNIATTAFFEMPIPYPDLLEQEIIANFLHNIDVKINAMGKCLRKTKIFKQGLLQQLLV